MIVPSITASIPFLTIVAMAFRRRLFVALPLLHLASWPCFFDFFAKEPTPTVKGSDIKTASYSHLKLLRRLRKTKAIDESWNSFCRETGFKSTLDMPEDVLEQFVLNPELHSRVFLSAFANEAKLPKLSNDFEDDELELGGFMDSNMYGLVKSEKELQEEQRKLAVQIKNFVTDETKAALWRGFCLEAPDPDDEESKAVRGEMAARSELGRRKTALESWLDAETGKAPPGENKFGI